MQEASLSTCTSDVSHGLIWQNFPPLEPNDAKSSRTLWNFNFSIILSDLITGQNHCKPTITFRFTQKICDGPKLYRERREGASGQESPGWCWQLYSWLGWLSLASHHHRYLSLLGSLAPSAVQRISLSRLWLGSSDNTAHCSCSPTQPGHQVVLSHSSDGPSHRHSTGLGRDVEYWK